MLRLPPSSTRTATLFPDTTLFRSPDACPGADHAGHCAHLWPRSRRQAACKMNVVDQIMAVMEAAFERSEEHTSELPSLMRISYAVFCLKKKNITKNMQNYITQTTPSKHDTIIKIKIKHNTLF